MLLQNCEKLNRLGVNNSEIEAKKSFCSLHWKKRLFFDTVKTAHKQEAFLLKKTFILKTFNSKLNIFLNFELQIILKLFLKP